jgi:dUTP pyrophosphatase
MKVKKLDTRAKLPQKAHAGDLGYDLFTVDGPAVYPGQTVILKTGIAIQFPEGYGGFIKDRSSIATKRGLHTVAGVIDNGYVGEICVAVHNGTDSLTHIMPGEKIAQLVLIPTVNFPVEEVDTVFAQDERGTGGFGSTGN